MTPIQPPLPFDDNGRMRVPRRPRPGAGSRSWRAAGACLVAAAGLALGCRGDVEARMAEVRALQDVGQYTESVDELREILAVSPDLPEANYRLGVALIQTGDPSRAVWALQKASESPDYAIIAGLQLANAQMTIGNLEEAIRAADRVLEKDPQSEVALRIRAQANVGVHRLDEALADTEALIARDPDDYSIRVIHATVLMELGRTKEALAAHELVRKMGAESSDPQIQARSCILLPLFYKDQMKDFDKAEKLYAECADKFPSDPFIVDHVMHFYDDRSETEKATALIRRAVEKAPESLPLRVTLANRLVGEGQGDEAEHVLKEAAESFGSAAAWNSLAGFYRRQGQPEKALAAVEKVVELTGGGGEQLRFTQADVLVDLGQYDRAEEVASSLDEPSYAQLIRGRILLEQGKPAEALELFEKGIRHWPNNPNARYLAGRAAYESGNFERAITELREATRASKDNPAAPRLLARLYFERGEYPQAIQFATTAVRRSRGNPAADDLKVAARSYAARGEFDKADVPISMLKKAGFEKDAAVEAAFIAEARSGPNAAVKSLESSGLDLADPANEAALRSLVSAELTLGRTDAALARIDAALKRSPDAATLYALRGGALANAGRNADAQAAYEKARALDPKLAEPLGGLASLAEKKGDAAGAVKLFDQAAKLAPDVPDYAYSAAQLSLRMGNVADAKQRLREIVRTAPGHAGARNDLAWLLADSGEDLDQALALAEEARRLQESPEVLDTLGWVHLKRGDATKAAAIFEQALKLKPDSPSIRYRLGLALRESGDDTRAAENLRSALAAGAFPEAGDARRELAQLEHR